MVSSSDEGEIVEHGSGPHSKATSPPPLDGSGVDRRDRLRDDARAYAGHRYANSIGSRNSRSPDRRSDNASDHSRPRSGHPRNRSPQPRGYKRGRDERDDRDRYDDGRWPRSRHDDDPRRHRGSYVDLDRPNDGHRFGRGGTGRSGYSRDYKDDRYRDRDGDRDGYSNKRPRNRTRSPPHRRDSERSGASRGGQNAKAITYEERDSSSRRDSTDGTKRASGGAAAHDSQRQSGDAKREKGQSGDVVMTGQGESRPGKEPEDEEPEPEPVDEEAEIERRRRRREAILAKSSSATPLLLHALHVSDKPLGSPRANSMTPDVGTPLFDAGSPALANDPESPDTFDFEQQDLGNKPAQATEEDGPSAADYDPTADMKEDERRDELRHGNVHLHGQPVKMEPPNENSQEQVQETESRDAAKDDDDDDNEEEDDFDMFAADFDETKYTATNPAKPQEAMEAMDITAPGEGGILEGDDKDGYYKIRLGEVLNGRYQIQAQLGKGMFSGVARAVDLTTKKVVAIKMMRNNDALRKGGYTEIAILQKLNEADPEGRKHIVRFEHHFDFKGHLCLAFENLSMNLREVLRKFGNNVGINLQATRAYAHQIFVGLAHMRRCSIIHADLKPDNILINESRNVLKICDLGTAIDRSDAATAHDAITPYLVSRFYRAPELVLGMPYDYAVDMWSIGCTLYELYTGKILFTGDNNNQMLRAIMEVRGKMAPKLYKKGQLWTMHFDDMGRFQSAEKDKFGKTVVKTLPMIKPTRDLRTRLTAASSGLSEAESRDLSLFIDLLEHCLALNPDKRIKPTEALKHPFFTSKISAGKK